MELREYALIVRRRFLVVVVATVVGLLGGYVASRGRAVTYTATVKLVAQQFVNTGTTYHQAAYASQLLALNDAALATSYPILQRALARAPGIRGSAEDLSKGVTSVATPNAAAFAIRVTARPADQAIRGANGIAQAFVSWTMDNQQAQFTRARASLTRQLGDVASQMDTLQQQINALQLRRATAQRSAQLTSLVNQLTQLRAQSVTLQGSLQQTIMAQVQLGVTILIVQPARLANVDVSRPNRTLLALLASLGGAILGLVAVFLLHYLSDAVSTRERVEPVSTLPSAGTIAAFTAPRDDQVIVALQPRTAAAEDYRLLGAHLHARRNGCHRPSTTILITSPQRGDGKTTTVANLAVALAESGASVIAVDANFLHPRLHTLFGLMDTEGVVDVLHNGSTAVDNGYLQYSCWDRVRVLPAGRPNGNAASLASSPQMAQLLASLRQQADVVLVDGPALLEAADASLLASQMDSVIMVVDATNASARTLSAAEPRLVRVGAAISGLVVNKAT